MDERVDIVRLQGEIDALAGISEVDPPAVTRIIFSRKDLEARAFVRNACLEAGLDIREDAVGNMFARWSGSDSTLAAVATGSHIDAIPLAGRYDGTVGVLGGLESIRLLQREGFHPRRSIELIMFTSEEPTRFGVGCLGSRLLTGALDLENALNLAGSNQRSLGDWLAESPWAQADRSSLRLGNKCYEAFIELHIEQGPVLERESLDVGVVTHIAAPASYRVSIKGEGGHAGAVLMSDRHDAFCGAAEFVLALEAAARESGSVDTVATVGVARISPGAINSIPSEVKLEVDLRDIRIETRDAAWERALRNLERISEYRGLNYTVECINQDAPAECDSSLVSLVEAAAKARGFSSRRLISRAYHDSLFMARVAPTVIIFIPCRNGWSHRPDEFSSPEQIARGVAVLADTLRSIA